MSETPLLSLPILEAGQAQKHVTHNEALLLLDAAIHLSVKTRSATTPPGALAEGDRYLLDAVPTGVWAGQAGKLAVYQAAGWIFSQPREGWRLWAEDEDKLYVFDGTTWRDVQSTGTISGVSLLGINATADTTDRLVVSSSSVLLNHAGTSHRLKINKQAASDTATVLLQDNFSGRAEFGLAGDDNFHLKVSADGSTWTEALVVDRASGAVSLPNTSGSGGSSAYALRSAFVTAVAGGLVLGNGTITDAGGLAYLWQSGATAVPGLPGVVPAGDAIVDHFGAVADGATDCTAAVQAAIAYALGTGGQRDVRFGSGTYYFPSITSLDPGAGGLTFVGDGPHASIIKFEEGTSGSKRYWMKNITNSAKTSLRFMGLQFLGTLASVAQRAGNPLWLDYYSDVWIEDCRFYNIGGEAMDFHYCQRFLCINCDFENIGADAIRARDTSDCVITGNQIRRCGDDPIALHTNASTLATFRPIRARILVSGNTLANCNGSIKVIGAVQTIIVGNSLALCHSHGIVLNSGYLGAEGENPQHDIIVADNIILDMVNVRSGTPTLATDAIGFVALQAEGGTSTNGTIPGDYDATSGTVIKPWDWYEGDRASTADATPRMARVRVTGNVIGRTRKAVAAYSDWGFGSALWQGVAYDPAVSEAMVGASYGVWMGTVANFVSLDISGNSIENMLNGIGLPAPTTHRDYQNVVIAGNVLTDVQNRGILIDSGAFTVDALIEGNSIDGDPFRLNANSNVDGTYDADATPRGIDTGNCTGLRLVRNTVRNVCKPLATNVAASIIVQDNTAIGGQPAALGFSTSNKGIGNVPSVDGWEYLIGDHDLTSATYRNHTQKLAGFAAAMPSSGWYPQGWLVRDTTGTNLGWVRKTTGTAHVLNTDWLAIGAGGGGGAWGTITGTLSAQSDLQTALDAKVDLAGDTMTGKLNLPASGTGAAGLNIGQGAAPTTPVDGDLWGTTAGLFFKVTAGTHTIMLAGGAQAVTAKKTFNASVTGGSMFSLLPGVDPTTPSNGDIWTTTTDIKARLNGATVTLAQVGHTHVAANVSDFSEAVDDRVAALLVAGTNVTLTYNDGANTLTIDAAGGGGGVSDGDKGDITVTSSGTVWTIDSATITLAKMANLAANSILGNNTGAGATPIALTAAQVKTLLAIANTDVSGLGALATQATVNLSTQATGTLQAAQVPVYSGDVTSAGGALALTIANDAVTNAKLANVATATLKGRVTAATGDPEDLTGTQATTLLDVATGALKGLLSAADKTKLDAITGTNTGDETAAGILAKLLTVDGSGSGLDADTLDGSSSAAFAAASHTHTASAISDSTTAGRAMLTAADVAAQTALLNAFTSALKGLVPASGGGTLNFLRADGSFAPFIIENRTSDPGSPVTGQIWLRTDL